MCSSRGDTHFDSILDEKLITETINNFKEATDTLDQKLKTIKMSAEGVFSKLAESDDHFKCLQSDVTDNIQCLEKLLKEVKEKRTHNSMNECGVMETSDSQICGPLLQAEFIHEQRHLIAKKKLHEDFSIPSHSTLLQEVSEMQRKLCKLANRGLDSAVEWIEKAKEKAKRTVKDQNEMNGDLRKRFANLRELAVQVQQATANVA